MPSPLPGRLNALFTNKFLEREDIEQIRGDVCEALKNLKQTNRRKNIFVIGGPNLILQSRPVLDKVYITRIPGEYLNDTSIDLAQFLEGMKLHQTVNLGTCIVEEYHNETIPPRTKTHTRKRKEQD
jgi:dihydrofolate reductase